MRSSTPYRALTTVVRQMLPSLPSKSFVLMLNQDGAHCWNGESPRDCRSSFAETYFNKGGNPDNLDRIYIPHYRLYDVRYCKDVLAEAWFIGAESIKSNPWHRHQVLDNDLLSDKTEGSALLSRSLNFVHTSFL